MEKSQITHSTDHTFSDDTFWSTHQNIDGNLGYDEDRHCNLGLKITQILRYDNFITRSYACRCIRQVSSRCGSEWLNG